MRDDLTVRDAMTREFVGVSEGDAVSGVAALMVDAGVDGAVVLRGAAPVGVIDARDVVGLVASGEDPDAVTAESLAADGAPTVGPEGPLEEAVSLLTGHDVRRLVVTDADEVLGTLSEHDVIVALSTFPEAEARDTPLAVAGTEPTGDEPFSTQSVCEACGALAGNLANVNGQLLCADCREL